MELDGFVICKNRHKRLYSQSVQSRSAVEKNGIVLHDVFQNAPDFRLFAFNEFLCIFDLICFAHLLQAFNEIGLKELHSHLFGQAALIEFELGTNRDHRASGIVNTLSEQVLTEASLFSLELIGERFERTGAATTHGACLSAIIDQCIHSFLKHALFIAEDNFRRADLKQAFEAVVARDHSAIEIVKVCRSKASTFQGNQRAQRGRQDGQCFQDHVSRIIPATNESIDYFQLIDQLLFSQR